MSKCQVCGRVTPLGSYFFAEYLCWYCTLWYVQCEPRKK